MANIVYVLTNMAMPNLVKIGRTDGDSVESRIKQLNAHSGVPLPFECHFAAEVENCVRLEKTLHQLFADHRINPKREFFKVDPEKVVLAISIGKFQEVTPGKLMDSEEEETLEKIKARRPRLTLQSIGLYPGNIIVCSRDETITATVTDNGKVDFQGEIMSLSAAALKALQQLGYKTTAASGSDYWMFDGETLDERRIRMEAEQFEQNQS